MTPELASVALLSSAETPAIESVELDARRLARNLGGALQRSVGAFERRAVRQLHGREQIALVLDRQEPGRDSRQPVAGGPDHEQRDDGGDAGVTHHGADQPHIAALAGAVDAIEGAERDIALFRRHRRPQPERALRGFQRGGVDRAQERGRGDHQRELRIHLPGQAREERRGNEHRHQHQRDADDRAEQFVHRLDRGVVAVQAALDIVGGPLHHDDGVVHHDADGEHDREQGRQIDGEAERPHPGKRADDRDRHGGGRHQHGAPVLQEDQDHDQHQHRGFDQRAVHLIDRRVDEFRGVERDLVRDALRKRLGEGRHLGVDQLLDLQRVRARRLENTERSRRLPVLGKDLAVGLRAELDLADVLDPDQLATGPLAGLDHDILVLLDLAQPSGDVDGVLEILSRRHRRDADLARGHLLALRPQRGDHILRRQSEPVELVRVHPHPHRILSGAEHGDVADPRHPRQLVAQTDGAVIGEKQTVAALVRRRQRDEHQDRGGFFLDRDALGLHRVRQLRQRAGDAVLHQHLREIQVGADLEGHDQIIGAVRRAGGLHVQHVLDAVDLLLDRQRHGVDNNARTRARIDGRHLHRRRRDVRILRDRQIDQRDQADHDHQDRDHVGEDGALDEEF